VAFSPDGTLIASGSDDMTMRTWDARSGKAIMVMKGHTSWLLCIAFSPDGAVIASGSTDGTVRTWDARSVLNARQEMTTLLQAALPRNENSAAHAFLSQDGQRDVCKQIFAFLVPRGSQAR